ncbi:MAG: hypothetical protein JNL58_25790 [Planctomyces sp.]|nr:hypothetical protein [Planctomyces sp.]
MGKQPRLSEQCGGETPRAVVKHRTGRSRCRGQFTNDTSRPAATALNWNGLTIDQWNVLSVSGWDNLLVDHVPTGGAGMLEYSPTGNRLTQTDSVTGDV